MVTARGGDPDKQVRSQQLYGDVTGFTKGEFTCTNCRLVCTHLLMANKWRIICPQRLFYTPTHILTHRPIISSINADAKACERLEVRLIYTHRHLKRSRHATERVEINQLLQHLSITLWPLTFDLNAPARLGVGFNALSPAS